MSSFSPMPQEAQYIIMSLSKLFVPIVKSRLAAETPFQIGRPTTSCKPPATMYGRTKATSYKIQQFGQAAS